MDLDKSPDLFAVYAHADTERMHPLLQAFRKHDLDIWMNVDRLTPGRDWMTQTTDAMEHSLGALLFLSSRSAKSHFVAKELKMFQEQGKAIFVVVLEPVADPLPEIELLLLERTCIDMTSSDRRALDRAAERIRAWATEQRSIRVESTTGACDPTVASSKGIVHQVASLLVRAARKEPVGRSHSAPPPREVFIVHGHDDALLHTVDAFLNTLGIEPVVLRRIGGPAQSLFQKFWQWGEGTRFAIVLLTADDIGASRIQFEEEGVGERALQFRARQNVILELGFFYGYLGWERVFVLFKKSDRVFPNFELPSDLDGVVFDMVDELGQWKEYLTAKLKEGGFVVS